MSDEQTVGARVGSNALLGEQRASAMPLDDLLRSVPPDARMSYEHDRHHHSLIPVGRLCAEALAEIERLRNALAERQAHWRDAAAEIERLHAVLRGECETEYDELTDEECTTFRMTPGSFNDMVRVIHRHGWDGALLFMPPNEPVEKPAAALS